MGRSLLDNIRACKVCEKHLPFPPRPVLQFSPHSKIVLIGQAPGTKVHASGLNWNDPSGVRLRQWLDVSEEHFYNTRLYSIVPMGFCYPGKAERGDLPPRPECAELWMQQVLSSIRKKQLLILIGQYAQQYFLGGRRENTLTETVRNWREYLPEFFVLPHPSPRNNLWLRKNPWFEREVVPSLQETVKHIQAR